MFYTNKQVAEQINEIYNSDSNRSSNSNALKLPEKYEMLDKLNSRQPIMLYYLKNSVTPAKEQDEIYSDWFSCLITTNGRIILGSREFWDWEDDELTKQNFQKYNIY
mgnify:CR=1 FL=1